MTMIAGWSDKLRRRLSSNSVHFQTQDGVQELSVEDRGSLWVIDRSICVFRSLDVSSVPSSKREQAVSAQIGLISPYKKAGYWYCIQKNQAKIWIWDETQRLTLAESMNLDVSEQAVLPSACFTDEVGSGTFLYKAHNGYFAHIWQQGELIADSWWADLPDDRDWRSFLRGVGDGIQQIPEVQSIDFAVASAWESVNLSVLSGRSLELALVKASVVLFLFLFGFQMMGSLRLVLENWQINSQIAEVSQTHSETINVREQAFRARKRGDQILDLGGASQFELMSAIAHSLPETNQGLISWQFQQGELEFVVADPSPNLEVYVRKMEAVPHLAGVSVDPMPRAGQLKVKAGVTSP